MARINRIALLQADAERVKKLVPRPGKYRTLVLDPPWDYDWPSLAGLTTAMKEAGVVALYAYDNDEMFNSAEERVERIFSAMINVKTSVADKSSIRPPLTER